MVLSGRGNEQESVTMLADESDEEQSSGGATMPEAGPPPLLPPVLLPPASELLSRVQRFLPRIREANLELLIEKNQSGDEAGGGLVARAQRIDTSLEHCEESSSSSSSSTSESSSDEEDEERKESMYSKERPSSRRRHPVTSQIASSGVAAVDGGFGSTNPKRQRREKNSGEPLEMPSSPNAGSMIEIQLTMGDFQRHPILSLLGGEDDTEICCPPPVSNEGDVDSSDSDGGDPPPRLGSSTAAPSTDLFVPQQLRLDASKPYKRPLITEL
jgi:hypothetical protein